MRRGQSPSWSCQISVDVRDRPRNLDIGPFQHLLQPVQISVALPNQTLAVVYQFQELTLILIRDVTRRCCTEVPYLLLVAFFETGSDP